jgi:hypothetical protein
VLLFFSWNYRSNTTYRHQRKNEALQILVAGIITLYVEDRILHASLSVRYSSGGILAPEAALKMFGPGPDVESLPPQPPGPSRRLGRKRINVNQDHLSSSIPNGDWYGPRWLDMQPCNASYLYNCSHSPGLFVQPLKTMYNIDRRYMLTSANCMYETRKFKLSQNTNMNM